MAPEQSKPYHTPQLKVHGKISSLAQAGTLGTGTTTKTAGTTTEF